MTIVLDRERDAAGNTRSAIFSATGAINDVGAFTVEGVHLGGIGAPTFGVVQTLNRLEDRHGTLLYGRRTRSRRPVLRTCSTSTAPGWCIVVLTTIRGYEFRERPPGKSSKQRFVPDSTSR